MFITLIPITNLSPIFILLILFKCIKLKNFLNSPYSFHFQIKYEHRFYKSKVKEPRQYHSLPYNLSYLINRLNIAIIKNLFLPMN